MEMMQINVHFFFPDPDILRAEQVVFDVLFGVHKPFPHSFRDDKRHSDALHLAWMMWTERCIQEL